MSMNEAHITCPECGQSETVQVSPSMYISAEVELTIKSIRCSRCEYQGPPGGSDD